MDWPPNPPRPSKWAAATLQTDWMKPSLFSSISSRLKNAFRGLRSPSSDFKFLAKFLRSHIDHYDHDNWEVDRLLGRGGFGKVGLWIRRDDKGQVVDEIAIKEELSDLNRGYREDGEDRPSIAKEAVVQSQLNEHGSQNIGHLRAFRGRATFDEDPERAYVYRFYQEYAPYGDLSRLKLLYRAKNQMLPEAFLWHVFDSLANAARVMAKGPKRKYIGATRRGNNKLWPSSYGVVHFDLKPANILLSYEKPTDATEIGGITVGIVHYPIVKLGDFGLSEITGEGEHTSPVYSRINPNEFWHLGTPYYHPPEQMHYGIDFRDPPNSHKRRPTLAPGRKRNTNIIKDQESDVNLPFHFHNASNVWNIGKVLYDLATMSASDGLSYCWATTEEEYIKNGNHFMSNFRDIPIRQSLGPNFTCQYSEELTNLIRDCLKPEISDRVTYDQLWTRTRTAIHRVEHEIIIAGKQKEAQIARQLDKLVRRLKGGPLEDDSEEQREEDPLAKYRLFYDGSDRNSINYLPYNSKEFQWLDPNGRVRDGAYRDLLNITFRDPNWPELEFGAKWNENKIALAGYFNDIEHQQERVFVEEGIEVKDDRLHFTFRDWSEDDRGFRILGASGREFRILGESGNETDSSRYQDENEPPQPAAANNDGRAGASVDSRPMPKIKLKLTYQDPRQEKSQAPAPVTRSTASTNASKKRKQSEPLDPDATESQETDDRPMKIDNSSSPDLTPMGSKAKKLKLAGSSKAPGTVGTVADKKLKGKKSPSAKAKGKGKSKGTKSPIPADAEIISISSG